MTLEEMKSYLGDRYLMHPDNQVKKIRRKKTVFEKIVTQSIKSQIRAQKRLIAA